MTNTTAWRWISD